MLRHYCMPVSEGQRGGGGKCTFMIMFLIKDSRREGKLNVKDEHFEDITMIEWSFIMTNVGGIIRRSED